MGIEPTPSAWKAEVLPVNYTRLTNPSICRNQSPCSPAAPHRRPVTGNPVTWWRGKDSNLRRHKPADLQSAPVGRLGTPPANEPRIFGFEARPVNGFSGKDLGSCDRRPVLARRGEQADQLRVTHLLGNIGRGLRRRVSNSLVRTHRNQ